MEKKRKSLYYCLLIPGIIAISAGHGKIGIFIMFLALGVLMYDYFKRKQ
jgi:hypothetical protein